MVNRDELIRYLLHQMPEEERLDFAERWFGDQKLSDELSMAEAELLDDYTRGALPDAQRELVERFLLNSDEQRQKLNFAATLGAALKKPRRARRMPWLAMAAAVIVGLAGVTAWLAAQNHGLHEELAAARTGAVRETTKPAPGGIYVASIAAQDLRGASQERTVEVPRDARMLRLEVELPEGEKRPSYAASVSARGRRVWREDPAKSEDRQGAAVAVVWIPADIMTAGVYTVLLEAEGGPVASYRVRIVR